MYLKKIELQGFKSFADKTVIEIRPGITAVIGPNGSGKSNISDAIRWVLGEQSVRTLRGSKLEDVIFAGTQARKPVSFAEVTITLDNTDNKLPIENEILVNDYYQEGRILATKNDETDFFYVFVPIPNDFEKYYVCWSDIYSSATIFEIEKEIEVALLPEDIITITEDRDRQENVGKELTVEEFYQKAINNEKSSEDSIKCFEYNLSSIGNSSLPWGIDTNAVNFENGRVNINFHFGGI